MHLSTVKYRMKTICSLFLFLSLTGCQSAAKSDPTLVPITQNQQILPIQVYYEATPVASEPKPKPKSRFRMAAFHNQENEWSIKNLSGIKKDSSNFQAWSHATIHLQYPHPDGKQGFVLSTVKAQRETPPRMFEENRPAPIRTQLNKMQQTSNNNRPLFRLASSSKVISDTPTQVQNQKTEYEIWKLDIPIGEVAPAFRQLTMNSNSIKYSDRGNARLHWQESQNTRVSMRCDNLPFIEKIIQRTYHEGKLAGFRFDDK